MSVLLLQQNDQFVARGKVVIQCILCHFTLNSAPEWSKNHLQKLPQTIVFETKTPLVLLSPTKAHAFEPHPLKLPTRPTTTSSSVFARTVPHHCILLAVLNIHQSSFVVTQVVRRYDTVRCCSSISVSTAAGRRRPSSVVRRRRRHLRSLSVVRRPSSVVVVVIFVRCRCCRWCSSSVVVRC